MTAKKVLLAGSSFSAVPIFKALRADHLHITVAGNLPDDPCHALGDESLYFDYSNPDDLIHAVETHGFDYVVPTCNDESYISCAQAAALFNLPGFDTVDNTAFINTKNIYRSFLEDNDFPCPYSYRAEDIDEADLPVLVKPVDSSGGKGVHCVKHINDLNDAIQAAKKASRQGNIVIESFVQGTLHSHSAFLIGGAIDIDFFVDEFCTLYPYQVNCSHHPSQLSQDVMNTVRDQIKRLSTLRNLADGLIHTQFMMNGSDIRIIESMRRCPGDLFGTLIQKATGFDYYGHYIRPFIETKYPTVKPLLDTKPIGRHTIAVDKPIEFQDIAFEFSDDLIDVIPLKKTGDIINPMPYDKYGLMFIDYQNKLDMLDVTKQLMDYVTITGKVIA